MPMPECVLEEMPHRAANAGTGIYSTFFQKKKYFEKLLTGGSAHAILYQYEKEIHIAG